MIIHLSWEKRHNKASVVINENCQFKKGDERNKSDIKPKGKHISRKTFCELSVFTTKLPTLTFKRCNSLQSLFAINQQNVKHSVVIIYSTCQISWQRYLRIHVSFVIMWLCSIHYCNLGILSFIKTIKYIRSKNQSFEKNYGGKEETEIICIQNVT